MSSSPARGYQKGKRPNSSPTAATIPGHATQTFVITLDAGELAPGSAEALLYLEHNDPVMAPVAELPVILDVLEPQAAAELQPARQGQAGAPGETVSYEVEIVNAGNITDTFSLSLASAWAAELNPPAPGSLAPGQGVSVTLLVTIPANAADGAVDTAVLTVTSSLDPGVTSDASFTTEAVRQAWWLYLPPPGARGRLTCYAPPIGWVVGWSCGRIVLWSVPPWAT